MKKDVLGVLVDATTHDQALDAVLTAARQQRPLAVTALAVHGVMTGVLDREHGARLNSFDLVTPDGQPVRWALNLLHGAALTEPVCGPDLTLHVLRAAADEGLPVYLYGSTRQTLDLLMMNLQNSLPALKIAGHEPSGFRTARPGEDVEIADRITASGARIVLVGLGCPRQEIFVHAMRPLLSMPLLAVGAAFDFHAGNLRRPPLWVRRAGLEWLWRLGLEPRRLWRRYLLLNPLYLMLLAGQWAGLRPAGPPRHTADRPAGFPV
ncbi:WecB/TagA/CpsF family glycosyltransferase [Streptomyces incarnatus]|uniref:WecB/TagA/CpsF family glycosyltransferase n=1 Tax=Streptomyces incarnatus TaxID=665007 RepID=UPI000A85BB71|nr:WecB/TagA/CpsF family glycosyltransferase [Streptomyces incarnatus]